MKVRNFKDFEKKIGLKFSNKELLFQIFVHRSYLNEHPEFELESNERLEFLGDAILELIVTEYLYENYPNPEGELTNWRASLVNGTMLSELAKDFKMGEELYLSKGEEKTGGKSRQLILANCFEALIGAIYLDKGYETAKKFVKDSLLKKLPAILKKKLYIEPKSHLQEIVQETHGITPSYRVISEAGPDHAKIFTVGVYVNDKLWAKGRGPSKQNAEQISASKALKKIENSK